MGEAALRLDPHVRLVAVPGGHVLVDAVAMQRLTVDPMWAGLCGRAEHGWHTRAELAAAVDDAGYRAKAPAFIDLLVGRGFLIDRDRGDAQIDAVLTATDGASGAYPAYWQPDAITADDFVTDRPLRPVSALLIGGCVVQFAADALVRAGLRRGLAISHAHQWPTIRGRLRELIDRHDPDLVVLQPTVQPFLTGLWDDGVFVSAKERRRRLAVTKRALTGAITELADAIGSRFGLVHNVAPLAVSPFGRYDFRQEVNHRDIVADLNRHIDEQVRRHPCLFVVDEERITARHGAATLFDDLMFPFGHHGGRPDPAIETANQLPALADALAGEYIAGYLAHSGMDQVKCVVVDLDNTLWPGIAADDGFAWIDGDATSRWIHLGLHQALRVLRHRGVLLATCSKGTEAVTLDAWSSAPAGQILGPDDFVAHRINWESKSANIADLCDRLGVAPSAVVFLDDNPVERAEVRRHLPGVRVPELPVHGFREFLLTEPGLEAATDTDEARHRSETTRAMLRRTELAADGGDDFLRELDVTVRVRAAGAGEFARAAELFNRTNQFTTTAWRTTEAQLTALVVAGHELYLMSVGDRFADYGIVGACLIGEATVVAFAVSCRVIGLDVAPGFLATSIRLRPVRGALTGRIVRTDRNHAAHDVFLRAGFAPADADVFVLEAHRGPIETTGLPQRYTVQEEVS